MFLLVDATTVYLSLCRFVQRLNQSLPAATLAIGSGLGILLWAAKGKANVL